MAPPIDAPRAIFSRLLRGSCYTARMALTVPEVTQMPLADLDLISAALPGRALHEALRVARASGRAASVRLHGMPALLLTRFVDVKEFLADHASAPGGLTYARQVEPVVGRTFISMDGDDHRFHRQLATPAFRSSAVERFVDQCLAPLAHEIVDRFVLRGEGDLVAEFTDVLPFVAISRKLGLPVASEARQRIWARSLLSFPGNPEGARAASAELTAVIAPEIAARRRAPRDDVLSRLIETAIEGRRFDDEDILAHARLLYAVGATTTADAMSNLFWALLTVPGLAERARHEPSLRPGVVQELLRWEPPVAVLPRMVTAPRRIGGADAPAGSLVMLALAGANRDPDHFEDPDAFRPEREEREILTFGFGDKYCPGVHLARRQLRAALDVVLDRLPELRLAAGVRVAPTGATLRSVKALPVVWGGG